MTTQTTGHGIPYIPEGTTDPAAGINEALDVIDAVIVPRVISMSRTAPPGSNTDGDLYIVAASGATGAWLHLEDHLVRYVADGTFWRSYSPGDQVALVINLADDGLYRFGGGSPGGWTLAGGIADAPIDGAQYVRKDGAWQLASLSGLTVEDLSSPPQELSPTTLLIGTGLVVTDEGSGIVRIDGPSAGASSNIGPDTHPTSPTAWDDEFEFGTGPDTSGARRSGANAWSLGTPTSGSVFSVAQGHLIPVGTVNPSYLSQAVPGSTPYEFTAKIVGPLDLAAVSTPIGLWNSANGKAVFAYFTATGSVTAAKQTIDQTTFITSGFSSLLATSIAAIISGDDPYYLKIKNDGTNIKFYISRNGVPGTFWNFYSETISSNIGAATHVFIQGQISAVSGEQGSAIDWFRRTA